MTGTGLTRWHKLPYPVSQKVRGNGAADVERLAVRTDAELDAVGVTWTVVQKPDSAIFTLGSTFTGVVANAIYENVINWSTGPSWGANPPGSNGPGIKGRVNLEALGWYSVSICYSTIPSGTATVNSRRTIFVKVLDDSGSLVPVEQYIREDYEVGSGETILQLEFVAFFGLNYRLIIDFIHTNTGSTLNFTTTATSMIFSRITGTG